jgi:dipeptidyl aminopeptidase/acylaminoacyl peptidase
VPQSICELPSPPVGGAWNREGVIIFGSNRTGLWRVPASGGAAVALTALDLAKSEQSHQLPYFLSDGKRFLYLRVGSPENTGTFLGSIDAPPEKQGARKVLASRLGAAYVPPAGARPGWLFFLRDDNLLAQPFDEARLEVSGEPVSLAQGVGRVYNTGLFSASSGVLAHRAGSLGVGQLAWFDRTGPRAGTVGEPANFVAMNISPDGSRLAAILLDRSNTGQAALWVIELATGARTRLTFDTVSVRSLAWSPDGRRIAYSLEANPGSVGIYVKPSDGSRDAEKLSECGNIACAVSSWSNDSRLIFFSRVSTRDRRTDIWALQAEGERKSFPVLETRAAEALAMISPDGKWLAYNSDESGTDEVYVRPFTPGGDTSGAGPKWLVSANGGRYPKWRADGKQLGYIASNGETLQVLDVTTTPVFRVVAAHTFGKLQSGIAGDISPGLDRLLLAIPATGASTGVLNVLLNWQSAIK